MKLLRVCLVTLALINLLALMVGVNVVLVGISMGFERQPLYITLTLVAALAFVLFGWPVLRTWRSTWRILYQVQGQPPPEKSGPLGEEMPGGQYAPQAARGQHARQAPRAKQGTRTKQTKQASRTAQEPRTSKTPRASQTSRTTQPTTGKVLRYGESVRRKS